VHGDDHARAETHNSRNAITLNGGATVAASGSAQLPRNGFKKKAFTLDKGPQLLKNYVCFPGYY
jgi:hypothetical protein